MVEKLLLELIKREAFLQWPVNTVSAVIKQPVKAIPGQFDNLRRRGLHAFRRVEIEQRRYTRPQVWRSTSSVLRQALQNAVNPVFNFLRCCANTAEQPVIKTILHNFNRGAPIVHESCLTKGARREISSFMINGLSITILMGSIVILHPLRSRSRPPP